MIKTILFYLISFTILLSAPSTWAKEVRLLFIGNSLTFLPQIGTEEGPAIPLMIKNIASSIEPQLKITSAYSTHSGYTFEKHLTDAQTVKLMDSVYDKVILQGYSIDSFVLPPWWDSQRVGEKYFSVSLGKILKKILQKNRDVTLYVPWVLHAKNSLLEERHPGLRFPPGSAKAGKKWCGEDKHEFQDILNEGYKRNAQGYPVHFSQVGSAWMELQDSGLVTADELYISGDWKHASLLGGFIAALVLVRDVLQLDISKNTFIPTGINQERAKKIQEKLSKVVEARRALTF